MIVSEIKLYELLKVKLGEKEAEAFIEVLETRVDKKFEEKQSEFILEKDKEKLLTKADALAIFATKEDLAKVETGMIKWMFIFIVGLFISLTGVIFAMFNIYLKH
jgi:hypothetical protein